MDRDFAADDAARAAAGEPTEPLGTSASALGIVKYWKSEKGYGAIASDATSPWDIWCHFMHIEGSGFRELIPGEQVSVEYERLNHGAYRYQAIRVRRGVGQR